jgi:hypothetical protein
MITVFELTSVSGYQTLSSKFVAYTTIDVSAHTNYLIEFLKNFCQERCPTRSANCTREFSAVNTREYNIHN